MKLDEFLERAGDGLIGGVIAAVILLCYLISCLGCATTACPECIPEIKTITVKVPVLSCPEPEPLPTLACPDWPEVPQVASEEAYKSFYADVVATQAARESILLQHIAALETLLDSYNPQ